MFPRVPAYAAASWLVVAGALAVAPRPPVDNSVAALLASDAPQVQTYRAFQQRFGSDEIVVARLEGGTAFDRLRWSEALTSTLTAEGSVQGVLSVPALHSETTKVILDEVFGGPDTLEARHDELASPLVRQLGLWDAEAANVYGLAEPSSTEDRAELERRLEAIRRAASEDGVTLRFTGPPLLNLALDRAGRRSQAIALPLLAGVIVALTLALTRSLVTTVALLAPVGLTVVAAEGLFGLTGLSSNLLVEVGKPLILVIGLASAVHVHSETRHLVARGVSVSEAPWVAAFRKRAPVSLALLTTALGFGSLATSDVAPIHSFGVLTGVGLVLAIPAVLFGVPGALALGSLRSRRGGKSSPTAPPAEPPWVRLAVALVRVSLRHPKVAAGLGIAGLAAGAAAIPALRVEPHAIRYFAPEHPLRRDQAAMERAGLGIATVEAVISKRGIGRDPGAVDGLRRLAATGREDPAVAAVVGWPQLLDEARRATERPEIDQWLVERARDRTGSEAFARDDAVRIAFLVKRADADQLDALKARLRTTRLPDDWSLELTGNYDLLLQAQDDLLETLRTSLLWTATLMELVLLLVLRALGPALVALIPNLFPVALILVAMAGLDVPLDLGTSMTAAVALGLAVDDTLHFVLASGRSALPDAARSAGGAIVLSSVVMAAGFLVLLADPFAPTARFGGLCAGAMLGALVGDLVVLPPLLAWAKWPRSEV